MKEFQAFPENSVTQGGKLIPNSSSLSRYDGRQFNLNRNLFQPNSDGAPIIKAFDADLLDAGGNLDMTQSATGSGFWVPYVEGRAVVGYAPGGKTWCASGPFSGCILAVGKDRNGRIFCAHIAVQSGSTGPAAWEQYRADNGLVIWYENKIPLPSDSFFCGSYMFACFGGDGLTALTRVDVNVGSQMGGSNGTIFNVHKFK